MEALEAIIVTSLAVVAIDWMFVGRIASYYTDFDYRYWPLTWPRVASLILAAATALASALMFTPGKLLVWPLFVWAIVFGLWMIVAVDDVGRQRAIGYRSPPRYSDPDD